jgi:hypothetical protein
MEMASLFTLDAIDRAIGDFLAGLSVQRRPDRRTTRCAIANNLDAANGLTPRPRPGIPSGAKNKAAAVGSRFHFKPNLQFRLFGTLHERNAM